MTAPAQKTTIAQLSSLPAECPIAFTEGIILKVFNRRTGINPNPPNAPFAFQEVQLGEVDNPTITFPCQFAGVEHPEITRAHIGTKLQFVASNHNGKLTGVKIKADRVKPVPGQLQQYRNVLHITPTAAVVGLPVAGAVAAPVKPVTPVAAAPVPPAQPVKPVVAAPAHASSPTPAPAVATAGYTAPVQPERPAADTHDLKTVRRYYGRVSKLLAMSARAVDNANEAYMLISNGNQFSQELKDSATITLFLAGFKDYGRSSGLDANMPDVANAAFVELLKK